jgi:hypothetical protein
MPETIIMDTLFNTQANVNKFFTSPPSDGGGGEAIRHGRLATDGVDTYMEITIGTGEPGALHFSRRVLMDVADAAYNYGYNSPAGTIAYCYEDGARYVKVGGAGSVDWGVPLSWMPAGTRSFDSKAAALADNTSPPGTRFHVYGTTAADHGFYIKIGNGNIGARLGDVHELRYQDPNHAYPIELILRSFGMPGDPGAPAFLGWPDISDWDGHEFRFDMRVRNARFDPDAALVQHLQNYIPGQTPAADIGVPPGGAGARRAFYNGFVRKNPLTAQLGIGGDFNTRSPVLGVKSTEWRSVRVPLRAVATDWEDLGSVVGRNGMPGDSGTFGIAGDPGYYVYVQEHPSVFLKRPNVQKAGATGAMNSFMIVAHNVKDAGPYRDLTPPPVAKQTKGVFQFRGVQVVKL